MNSNKIKLIAENILFNLCNFAVNYIRKIKEVKFILLVFIISWTSCTNKINLLNQINVNAQFNLIIIKTDKKPGISISENYTIERYSKKYYNLINWYNKNNDGWKSSPNSHISNIIISQNNFRMLCCEKFVVVQYLDNNNETKQFYKQIKIGELDFLTDNISIIK